MTDFMRPQATAACPCGRLSAQRKPLAYADCCGRFVDHFDTAAAPDAEALMRSRYTAFVCGRAPYLLATWHASTRPSSLELDPGTKWLGLAVKRFQATGEDKAEVEFVARYRDGSRGVRLHEHSRFVRESGRWFYVEGDDLTKD
jgi:SEC-C motif-containing protein